MQKLRTSKIALGLFLALHSAHSAGMGADDVGPSGQDGLEVRLCRLERYSVIVSHRYPEGLPAVTDGEIDAAAPEGIHPDHRALLKRCSHRTLPGHTAFRAHGGETSVLASHIKKYAAINSIPLGWVPFCDYMRACWFVHKDTGEAAVFERLPGFDIYQPSTEVGEYFPSLDGLINQLWRV